MSCKVDGCSNELYSLGYCCKHYTQIRKFGKILGRTKFDPNEIILYDNYAEIVLYNNKGIEVARTVIDIEDVDKVKNYKWHLRDDGYVSGTFGKKRKYLHHFIMDIEKLSRTGLEIDHQDRNKLNNRKNNLKLITISNNRFNINIQTNNNSGIRGVYWNKKMDKWRGQIFHNRKNIHLGYFDKLEDAIQARIDAELKYFGKIITNAIDKQ